jgi:pimeloyl-ACP methyl ester carboxylesterase
MGETALARLKARPLRYAELTGVLRRHSVASLLALLDETYSRGDWLAECARIRCPVQIIAGADDRFPTVAMSERLAATIPAPVCTSSRAGRTSRIARIAPRWQGVMDGFLRLLGI